MPALIQLIQAPDRIFNPSSVRMARLSIFKDVCWITFCGGHLWEVRKTDMGSRGNAPELLFDNLRNSQMFLEHENVLYNPSDICQVVLGEQTVAGIEEKLVVVHFLTGTHDVEFVTDKPTDFYGKWAMFKKMCDQALAQMNSPIVQQQSGIEQAMQRIRNRK